MRQGFDDEFNAVLNDLLSLHKPDGRVFEGIRAHVSLKGILIIDVNLPIEVGDKLIRTLQNGLRDVFIVDDPGYHEALMELPAHFQVKVNREGTAAVDSDFWRTRRAEFDDLALRQRSILGHPPHDKWLSAYCDFSQELGEFGSCRVQGGYDGRLISDFEEVATRAACALERPPGIEPVPFWLNCLGRDLLKASNAEIREEFSPRWEQGGFIQGLLESSASYCSRLAAKAERHASDAHFQSTQQSKGAPHRETAERRRSSEEFWKDRKAEFERYANEYRTLDADWNVTHRMWLLRWGSEKECFNVPQECKGVFNAIARKATTAVELSRLDVADNTEPWRLWLDFMRESKWGFRATGGPVACTEREWDAGVKDGKPLAQVRREQKYTMGDEWTKVYRRTKSGKLRRLSARELKHKSSEDLQKYYHWLENGSIEHVFEASADFCEELTSLAFELEAAPGNTPNDPLSVNPFPANDLRHGEWLVFSKEALRSLRSVAENQRRANEQIGQELGEVISALPEKRDQLWVRTLPTLRSIQPTFDWPETVPTDAKQITQLLIDATMADSKVAVLRRLDILAGNALTRFVTDSEDLDRIKQLHQYLEESALAVLGEEATDFVRIVISQQRWRWEETAQRWVEHAELPERRWNIGTSGNSAHGKAWVGEYERLAVAVMDALGTKFEHPLQAADALLDSLSEYLYKIKSPYASDWAIRSLCIATAKYVSELRTRAVKDGVTAQAKMFGELRRRFRELAKECGESGSNGWAGLHAYHRGVEGPKPKSKQPATGAVQPERMENAPGLSRKTALQIMTAAMDRLSLNPPRVAEEIRALLRPRGQRKLKVDRTTIYRILNGSTRNPDPAIRNALIDVLKLSMEDAALVRQHLGRVEGPKTSSPS